MMIVSITDALIVRHLLTILITTLPILALCYSLLIGRKLLVIILP